MKKIIYLFSVLFLFSCNSDEITPPNQPQNSNYQRTGKNENILLSTEQAKVVAINFFSTQTKLKIEEIKVKSIEIINDYNKEVAVYSVNIEPIGFVLVSANTRNVPIIAFSDDNLFIFDDNSPDGLKSWLAESILLGDELEKMEKPTIEIQNQWADLGIGSRSAPGDEEIIYDAGIVTNQYGPLLQTKWGQGDGYNDFTPYMGCTLYTNGNAPTGCVATAAAQIMKYHQWPISYSWSQMPNIGGVVTTSHLMKDIGDVIGMSYACNGSGAQVGATREGLVNVFGY